MFLPAAIVAARFLLPGRWSNDWTWFFAATGFIATFVGCAIAVLPMLKIVQRIPVWSVALISTVSAAILLLIFPTMPSWPLTDIGFVVAWVAMSATFSSALLFVIGLRYA